MSTEPLVSIIINCFNGEKYLKQSIESIISQTYKNWEVIFWDNKSTDNSAKIYKSYKDIRLKYYLAEKHSNFLYEARNYALQKTNGEFIAFLDVDDWWLPDKLEKQIALFKDPEVGLVYGNLWRFFEKKNKKKILKKNTLPTGFVLDGLLEDYVIRTVTMIVKKEYLNKLEYKFNSNFHVIGDFDLNIRMACICKVACVQKPIAFVRIHGTNESLLNKEREINEFKEWYSNMKSDQVISKNPNFKKIPLKISYLEITESILKDKFSKNFLKVIKYPLSLYKFKLIAALFLPKFILRKIKSY
tara:strand:- start:697 stop:1599 length:903 start_codon:yes stop_codon:yes gene_type:complete